jgi:hypothetical protein
LLISVLSLGILLLVVRPATAAFEITGEGARSTALGGAFAAGVNSLAAVWHNPAGNARLREWQGGTTQVLLHPGLEEMLSVHGLAVAGPVGNGVMQAGLSLLNAEGWREDVVVIGYGRALHPRLALGGVLRTSAWQAGDWSRRAWGMDVSGIYDVGYVHPRAFLRLGWILKDLNRANIAVGGQTAGRLPRGVVLAASLIFEGRQLLMDLERSVGRTEFRMGYETSVISLFGARVRVGGVGIGPGWSGKDVSVGIGNDWKRWHFDYACTYPLRVSALGGLHRLSLRHNWR